MLTLVIINKQK